MSVNTFNRFTVDVMSTDPVSPEILDTLQLWKSIAKWDQDSQSIIQNLIGHAKSPLAATKLFSYEDSLSASKFIVVRGGNPQNIQAIAFVVQTKAQDTFEPMVVVGDMATAPWNRPSGLVYAKNQGITPIKGAGTRCLAACAILQAPESFQKIALKSLPSAVGFYSKLQFTKVSGNALWGIPMELSAEKAEKQFKRYITQDTK